MTERILVVDDNRATADALSGLIKSFGYEAMAVYDGQAAIEKTATFQPDMALIDISMPGLNGYDTVSQIRKQRGNAHLILVAVTGMVREEDRHKAYASGFDLHVAKPMGIETLKELLAILDPEGGQQADDSRATPPR